MSRQVLPDICKLVLLRSLSASVILWVPVPFCTQELIVTGRIGLYCLCPGVCVVVGSMRLSSGVGSSPMSCPGFVEGCVCYFARCRFTHGVVKSELGIICLAEEIVAQGVDPKGVMLDALFSCNAMIVAYSRYSLRLIQSGEMEW